VKIFGDLNQVERKTGEDQEFLEGSLDRAAVPCGVIRGMKNATGARSIWNPRALKESVATDLRCWFHGFQIKSNSSFPERSLFLDRSR
jgi:hypothetical protein